MKQTAVEWLVKEFSEILGPLKTKPMQDLLIVDAINQAKQMEKEQMENVWHDSRVEDFGDDYIGKQISFNDYFNETFNTEDK